MQRAFQSNNEFYSLHNTKNYYFYIFISGSGDGYLKKVVIEGSSSGVEYANIPIRPGHAVRPDINFDLKREHVYAMTDKKVSKVRVQDCSIYTSCGECLGSKDPYCGWCSLENKCSLRGDCR